MIAKLTRSVLAWSSLPGCPRCGDRMLTDAPVCRDCLVKVAQALLPAAEAAIKPAQDGIPNDTALLRIRRVVELRRIVAGADAPGSPVPPRIVGPTADAPTDSGAEHQQAEVDAISETALKIEMRRARGWDRKRVAQVRVPRSKLLAQFRNR